MTAAPARKYNPGFLSDDELMASFCVRTHEFESIIEMLRECTGSSNQHQIVIGPRGSGKTTLLLRVAAEVRRDVQLTASFFPIVFAEESYEVGTAGEFWLECLARLADQAPERKDAPDLLRTLDELRTTRDDRQLGERCLGALLDFADREGKRLALMVENLNMMFRDMTDPDAGWRLRHTFQNEPRIVLLASATSRFDEIDHPDHALYDLFRVLTLRPLNTGECAVLWETVSGQSRSTRTIRSLEILTGGSPRLLAIVARFGAGLSFRGLMDNLLDLVDDHTEYFKSHLESLPPQERRVYLALAELWKPALTKEIAGRARLETSQCSAQLKRLVERGAVLVAGGSASRKQYYLSERMYNIYYLMRRSRGLAHIVEVLLRFMASYYSLDELKEIGNRVAREAEGEGAAPEMRSLYKSASARLMAMSEPPAREPEKEHVGSGVDSDEDTLTKTAFTLSESAFALSKQNRNEDALVVLDELLRQFGDTRAPVIQEVVAATLVDKGVTLNQLGRPEKALIAYDEVLRRFGESEVPELFPWVAMALVDKGVILGDLNRPEEALTAYDEVLRRFSGSEAPQLLEQVAKVLVNKGTTLGRLNRPEEELAAYDEVLRRFGECEAPEFLEEVAMALVNKGTVLGRLNRPEEELAAYDEVLGRFGGSEAPQLLEQVAMTLVNKGTVLGRLNRPEEELAAYDEVLRRFGESEAPELLEEVAVALVNKGTVLGRLNRPEEELTAYDEVLRRFGESEAPELLSWVAMTLVNKGIMLDLLNRPKEALAAYEEVVHRFGERDEPALSRCTARAYLNKLRVSVDLERPVAPRDIEALFKILPKLDALPRDAIQVLMALSIEIGPDRMLKLIQDFPAADLLRPLATALAWEMGQNPRVPEEVAEVAEDIRRDLAKLREDRRQVNPRPPAQ